MPTGGTLDPNHEDRENVNGRPSLPSSLSLLKAETADTYLSAHLVSFLSEPSEKAVH